MLGAIGSTLEKVDAHFNTSFAIFTQTRDFSPLTTTRTWIFYCNPSIEVQKRGWHLIKLAKIKVEVASEAGRHLLLPAEHLLPVDTRRRSLRKLHINLTQESSKITTICQVFHDPHIIFPSSDEFGGYSTCLFVSLLAAEKDAYRTLRFWQVASSLETSSPKHWINSLFQQSNPVIITTHENSPLTVDLAMKQEVSVCRKRPDKCSYKRSQHWLTCQFLCSKYPHFSTKNPCQSHY